MNTDTPIELPLVRRRKDYKKLIDRLGDAVSDAFHINPNTDTYQKEMETYEALSFAAYLIAKYIKDNAWKEDNYDENE